MHGDQDLGVELQELIHAHQSVIVLVALDSHVSFTDHTFPFIATTYHLELCLKHAIDHLLGGLGHLLLQHESQLVLVECARVVLIVLFELFDRNGALFVGEFEDLTRLA